MRKHNDKKKVKVYFLLFSIPVIALFQQGVLFFNSFSIDNKENYEWITTPDESHQETQASSTAKGQGSNISGKTDNVDNRHKDEQLTVIETDHGGQMQQEVQQLSSSSTTTSETRGEEEHFKTKHNDIKPSANYETFVEIVTNETCIKEIRRDIDLIWLCGAKIIDTALDLLQKGQDPVIVQIGAHIGFEQGDPIANGMQKLITSSTNNIPSISRDRFHWFFVEPSPPNYAKLEENINQQKGICKMHSIHAGIISEEQKSQDMIFYSLSDTIDPKTGYDSRSNRSFPAWITQVSSFKKESIFKNKSPFEKRGLTMEDYIVETKVPLITIDDLMEKVNDLAGKEDDTTTSGPLILVVDAEGNDCDIILGMSPTSKALPHYILFERNCHDDEKEDRAIEHLNSLGFEVVTASVKPRWSVSNHIAVRNDLRK